MTKVRDLRKLLQSYKSQTSALPLSPAATRPPSALSPPASVTIPSKKARDMIREIGLLPNHAVLNKGPMTDRQNTISTVS